MDTMSPAGGAGSFSFDDSLHSHLLNGHGRGRVQADDFGLPDRKDLLGLARSYLEIQSRLWPQLAGTAAVPEPTDAVLEAMADAFERRFRRQTIDRFQTTGLPKVWDALGIGYTRFSDEGSNHRSLDQQLLNVLTKAQREGVFVPWEYVCADAAVSGTIACRRGYTVAKMLLEQSDALGITWFIVDDLSRLSRNTIESLKTGELATDMGVRLVGASDGFDIANPQATLLLPISSSYHAAFIQDLRAKVRRGMDDAFLRGENIQPPGFGYRMVTVKDANGNDVYTRKDKDKLEKRAEIDPEAAAWIVRGAEMIAYEGKSPIEVARFFNENNVGGRKTWADENVRKLYRRERLVGIEVFRKSRQIRDRRTGKIRTEKIKPENWLRRESPHLRILTDELGDAVKRRLDRAASSFGRAATDETKRKRRADVYPRVLIRPVCGGCGEPMCLGRSAGKYQSFFCASALYGIHGCQNRGYKSARLIDEAVLKAVSATLFTEEFTAALTAEVNLLLEAAARRPQGSTKKLEQEIAKRERQIARITANLEGMEGDAAIKSVIRKVAEMQADLDQLREQLVEERRRNQRPPVTRVKEKEVLAELLRLRDLLQSDVGKAAPVLKGLVGDVVLEARPVEGKRSPEMVARFTIDAVPALAAIRRGSGAESDDPSVSVWEYLMRDGWIIPGRPGRATSARPEIVVSLDYDRRAAARQSRGPRGDAA
ncbi:MAG: hypothetical protein EBZ74_05580 [Planctomycetia bacterium]|nr:hypothetical protein [Planctomycetia bacterium]